ncbi:T9SS type A sorting domain-containing protein [Paracrocinitomix mangrovi]|uniref:T9SS type A sorting domain-containing protein n=1 Tax=Paracrocinitomix mangrovi TaxID=2862509 RepID=UPI001C8D87D4|nr:T9SS type A sorting domain-containing protein [Paracrocinitomix mangrovi]UKN01064.1 T9SS type A sorting domain-containing protein [Paracrocinitomix mangrovi]
MKNFILILTCLLGFSTFAHRGEILAIEKVKISETESQISFSYVIENIVEQNIAGVRIEFWQNGVSIDHHDFELIKADQKYTEDVFSFPKDQIDLDNDQLQIEITHIFSKHNDWGGWDGPGFDRQTNTLYSEFYADAPWRMKRTDIAGNDNNLPVHFFLHDADLVIGYTMKIDYIDIKIKNATDNNFGSTLLFDTLSVAAQNQLYSSLSINNAALNMQIFETSALSMTSSHTIDFDGETDFLDDFVSVDATYWYFTFNIPGEVLETYDNIIDVEATISYANTLIPGDDVIRMRVFRSDNDIPTQNGFYRGDTHLHSLFTQNDAEIGLPLNATKEAGKLIGLDWITTTDHTSDFDNYGNGDINTNWGIIQQQASVLNGLDSSLIYIAGQEVAANNAKDELVHMLVYPSYNDPFSLQFLGDGNGDLSATSVSVDNVVNDMATTNAFSYCAHPYATADKLPDIPVNGGIWNLGHNGFEVNGNNFPLTGGEIICNDINSPSDVLSASPNELVKEGIKGSQIWNLRWTLGLNGLSGDELDPFDVTNSGNSMSPVDTAGLNFHMKRFRQGQEIVNYINQLGLSLRNNDPSILNWKMYYSAGSDAHGSFNSSNTDDFGGAGDIHNNAVGKLNTLAYCPNGMGANGTNVLKALYNGNTTISDGPILTIGLSTDGDNSSNEVLMGQDQLIDYYGKDDIFLNINYTTTAEFGDIDYIHLYIGTELGEQKVIIPLTQTSGNNTLSFNLYNLLDSTLSNVAVGEFMYIRSELQTSVNYGAQSNVYLTSYDVFHSFSNPIWINWDVSSGLEDFQAAVSIYPNPFNDQLYISVVGHVIESLEIYNDLGQVVFTANPNTSQEVLKLNSLSHGLYLIKIHTDNGLILTEKLIKH